MTADLFVEKGRRRVPYRLINQNVLITRNLAKQTAEKIPFQLNQFEKVFQQFKVSINLRA